MQQSEGNILEVSGGRKRRQGLAFGGLLDHEISGLNSRLKRLDFGRDDKSAPEGGDAVENEREADNASSKLAGKKRLRRPQDTDSFVSDDDCELGDEDFFYRQRGAAATGSGTMVQSNTVVKLNKQEEEELIRELENQAMENDTLKELDEALMDRTTAQKTLRNKSQFMTQHTKINSSNFQKSSQEPA